MTIFFLASKTIQNCHHVNMSNTHVVHRTRVFSKSASTNANHQSRPSFGQLLKKEALEIGRIFIALTTATVGTIIGCGYGHEVYKSFRAPVPSGKIIPMKLSNNQVHHIHVLDSSQTDEASESNEPPTIILMDGSIGEFSYDWSLVWKELLDQNQNHQNPKKNIRLVAIDRPGTGYSSQEGHSMSLRSMLSSVGSTDRSSRTPRLYSSGMLVEKSDSGRSLMADILRQLDLHEPSSSIIWVGHGSSWLTLQSLPEKSLPNVKALVLIDPVHPQLRERLSGLSSVLTNQLNLASENMKLLAKLSYVGLPRLIEALQWSRHKHQYTREAAEFVKYIASSPGHRHGVWQELQAFESVGGGSPLGLSLSSCVTPVSSSSSNSPPIVQVKVLWSQHLSDMDDLLESLEPLVYKSERGVNENPKTLKSTHQWKAPVQEILRASKAELVTGWKKDFVVDERVISNQHKNNLLYHHPKEIAETVLSLID